MKLRSIQVLRGVAACSVVIYHSSRWYPGAAGVDLFFVISGFIIATIAPGKTASRFLLDRFWRVFPTYWIALVPFIFLAASQSKLTFHRTFSSLALWPITGNEWTYPYLVVGWTLCFEVLFYLAAAFTIKARSPHIPLLLYAFAVGAFTLSPSPLAAFLGSPLIAEFLLGVLIARAPKAPSLSTPLLVTGASLLLMLPASIMFAPDLQACLNPQMTIVRLFAAGLPSAAVVYGAVSAEGLFRRAAWRPVVLLGDASYSIYLFHFIPVSLAPGFIGTVAAIAAGMIAHFAIERPLLAKKGQLFQLFKRAFAHERGKAALGTVNPLPDA